jgi:hypothetical protein
MVAVDRFGELVLSIFLCWYSWRLGMFGYERIMLGLWSLVPVYRLWEAGGPKAEACFEVVNSVRAVIFERVVCGAAGRGFWV